MAVVDVDKETVVVELGRSLDGEGISRKAWNLRKWLNKTNGDAGC